MPISDDASVAEIKASSGECGLIAGDPSSACKKLCRATNCSKILRENVGIQFLSLQRNPASVDAGFGHFVSATGVQIATFMRLSVGRPHCLLQKPTAQATEQARLPVKHDLEHRSFVGTSCRQASPECSQPRCRPPSREGNRQYVYRHRHPPVHDRRDAPSDVQKPGWL